MNDKTSLWKLLEKYEIVIPIIQRDYAQGRKNKEGLRYRFLSSLKDALQNNQEMTLDFVYGGVQNGQMAPLDGLLLPISVEGWSMNSTMAILKRKMISPIISEINTGTSAITTMTLRFRLCL